MSDRTEPRVRAWLAAAAVVLLVGVYLTVWITYTRMHLPPDRYDALPPGVTASKLGGEFRLLSLRSTENLLDTYDGPVAPAADAVWVVAELEVTSHGLHRDFNCALVLVDDHRRTWEKPFSPFVSRPGESCLPDDAAVGRPYPVEVYFQVPRSEADHLAGVALRQFKAAPDPLLTPPR